MSNFYEATCPTCSGNYKGFSNYLQGAPIVYAKTASPMQQMVSGTPYNFGSSGFMSAPSSVLKNGGNYSTLNGKAYKQNVLFSAPYSARGCMGGN